MQFSFNFMRIKGLYMLRALLAHPQEVLQKRHLVYCVRIMSVACGTVATVAFAVTGFFDFWILDATDGLSRNVGTELPPHTA
jgi:hypothetical protein